MRRTPTPALVALRAADAKLRDAEAAIVSLLDGDLLEVDVEAELRLCMNRLGEARGHSRNAVGIKSDADWGASRGRS